MKKSRCIPRRYQLNSEASRIVRSGHPWIFRSKLSSAADVFENGQWLELVDGNNRVSGYGIFQKDGLIGVRVLGRTLSPPTAPQIQEAADEALKVRGHLRKFSNSFRAIHGENDGFPGVVIDVYGSSLLLQTYDSAVDCLGRFVAAYLCQKLAAVNIIWKTPTRRRIKKNEGLRILRGHLPALVEVKEGKLKYQVDLRGQKSGSFLDLRGLRKWITMQDWKGYRVLNLFSYTGTLGLAAKMADAREVWNVDVSQGVLDFGKKYHGFEGANWTASDILKTFKVPEGSFDVVIVDPPSMAGKTSQVALALRVYSKLYRLAKDRVKPGGTVIGACCTSRIGRTDFRGVLERALGARKLISLEPESDHPVGFPEGDYLKILIAGM